MTLLTFLCLILCRFGHRQPPHNPEFLDYARWHNTHDYTSSPCCAPMLVLYMNSCAALKQASSNRARAKKACCGALILVNHSGLWGTVWITYSECNLREIFASLAANSSTIFTGKLLTLSTCSLGALAGNEQLVYQCIFGENSFLLHLEFKQQSQTRVMKSKQQAERQQNAPWSRGEHQSGVVILWGFFNMVTVLFDVTHNLLN